MFISTNSTLSMDLTTPDNYTLIESLHSRRIPVIWNRPLVESLSSSPVPYVPFVCHTPEEAELLCSVYSAYSGESSRRIYEPYPLSSAVQKPVLFWPQLSIVPSERLRSAFHIFANAPLSPEIHPLPYWFDPPTIPSLTRYTRYCFQGTTESNPQIRWAMLDQLDIIPLDEHYICLLPSYFPLLPEHFTGRVLSTLTCSTNSSSSSRSLSSFTIHFEQGHPDLDPTVQYWNFFASSSHALCPIGDHRSSRRVYEAVSAGCIPIIYGDKTGTAIPKCLRPFCVFIDDDIPEEGVCPFPPKVKFSWPKSYPCEDMVVCPPPKFGIHDLHSSSFDRNITVPIVPIAEHLKKLFWSSLHWSKTDDYVRSCISG